MLSRIIALCLLSAVPACVFADSSEHRVTGSVWEGQAQIASFDFTAVPGKPARLIMSDGKELEIVVSPDGTRIMRLINASGHQLHSATVPPSGPTDRTFRYSLCGATITFASPEPADIPVCPQT